MSRDTLLGVTVSYRPRGMTYCHAGAASETHHRPAHR